MEIYKASIVQSLAGRDAGMIFAVIDIVDDAYVLVANGRQRKVETPKKKKLKHLKLLYHCNDDIKKRIDEDKLTNNSIRKALNALLADKEVF